MVENEAPTLYVDGIPSPLTISPSSDYDLLLQLQEGENDTFQHIIQIDAIGKRVGHYYVRHTIGFLGLVYKASPGMVAAIRVSDQGYRELIDNVLKEHPSLNAGEKDGVIGIFSDFGAPDEKSPLKERLEGEYGYRNFKGYDAIKDALEYIGWEK